MSRIVGHLFDGISVLVKMLRSNASVIIVQEVDHVRDEWRDFSGDGISKGGEVFGVYSFNGFLDDGSFKQ